MNWFRPACVAALLIAKTCAASPSQPVEGVDYVLLATPQKTSASDGKVEVREFLLFHCPFCARLEPMVKAWGNAHSNKVSLKTSHATFRGTNDPEVHLFLTLEAMNQLSDWRAKVFKATQREGVRMTSDAVVLDWARQNGLDYDLFLRTWNSPEVMAATARTPEVVKSYGLTYAPAFIVSGKFMTSPLLIQKNNPSISPGAAYDGVFSVLNYLVQHTADNARDTQP